MRKTYRLLSVIVLLTITTIVITSCGCCKNTGSNANFAGNWTVTAIDKKVLEGVEFPTMNIAAGKVNGTTGCNRYFGEMTVDYKQGTVAFDKIGCTKMLCAENNVENDFLSALNAVKKFQTKKKAGKIKLLLVDDNGNERILLEQK
jgi:heat shock protein HslJ